jgi:hypothetical protein
MDRCVAALYLSVACTIGTTAAEAPAWSGAWVSHSGDVVVVRNVHATAEGWDHVAQNLKQASRYTIAITQTANEIAISFPTGSNNILTVSACAIGADPCSIVSDHGDWWVKEVVVARWVNAALQLTSTTASGWWKDVEPDRAPSRITDFRKQLTLRPGSGPDQLLLRVVLGDEKGELEYVQTFVRER